MSAPVTLPVGAAAPSAGLGTVVASAA
jgi:hypothetical protein